MTDTLDLTGRWFGDLIVLSRTRKSHIGRYPRELWVCLCACGTTPVVLKEELLDGITTSCGTCAHPGNVRRAMRRDIANAETMVVCRACKGDLQPLEAFSRQASGRYGRRPHCKRCEAVRVTAWRERKKAAREGESRLPSA